MEAIYLIGTDIGSSSTKTVITDKYGKIVSHATEAYDIIFPHNGWAEEWPDVWQHAAINTIRRCVNASGLSPDQFRGICISGLYGGSGIPLDKNMKPIRPCIIWMDRRTDTLTKQLQKKLDLAQLMKITENGIDSYFGFTKILWIKENEPDLWEKIHLFMTPNQYVVYKLTGEITIDRTSACNLGGIFDFEKNMWSHEMCDILGIPAKLLPQRILNPYEIAGTLTEDAARLLNLKSGIPVCAGCIDCLSSNLSSGTLHSDQSVAILATSLNWGLLHTEKPKNPKYISMPYVTDNLDLRYTYGGISTAGALTKWFSETFSASTHRKGEYEPIPFSELEEAASGIPIGAEGLITLPYFMGERCPIWDSKARGTIMGLTVKHTAAHIYRSILESIGFALRHVIEDYGYSCNKNVPCRLVGGGASSQLWVHILADITGIPMQCMDNNVEAPIGDAFLSGYATGLFNDFEDISNWTRSYTVTCPDWENHERYEKYFKIYKEMFLSLKKNMHNLTDLSELPPLFNSDSGK